MTLGVTDGSPDRLWTAADTVSIMKPQRKGANNRAPRSILLNQIRIAPSSRSYEWRIAAGRPSQRLEGSRFAVSPDVNRLHQVSAYARVKCVGRRLPRTCPGVAISCIISLVRPIGHVAGCSRVETFPGAACYLTYGGATIFFRAIMLSVLHQSKAAPLQGLFCVPVCFDRNQSWRPFSSQQCAGDRDVI